jgi:hypothetical protein
MDKRQAVKLTITVSGETDRDPWEWAEGIARSLADDLNAANGEGWPPITVEATDAEPV